MLLQAIYKASPIDAATVYAYFLTFRDLDYTITKNRERLIEMFVRKVVLFDNGGKKVYFNCSEDPSGEINEKSERDVGFGFDSFGTEYGARTRDSGVRGQRPNR